MSLTAEQQAIRAQGRRFVNRAFELLAAGNTARSVSVVTPGRRDHGDIAISYGNDEYDADAVARLVQAAPEMFALLARAAVHMSVHPDLFDKESRKILVDACMIMDRVAGEGFCDAMEGDASVAAVRR